MFTLQMCYNFLQRIIVSAPESHLSDYKFPAVLNVYAWFQMITIHFYPL